MVHRAAPIKMSYTSFKLFCVTSQNSTHDDQ